MCGASRFPWHQLDLLSLVSNLRLRLLVSYSNAYCNTCYLQVIMTFDFLSLVVLEMNFFECLAMFLYLFVECSWQEEYLIVPCFQPEYPGYVSLYPAFSAQNNNKLQFKVEMCLQYCCWIPPFWVYSQFSLKRTPLGQALSVRRRKMSVP